MNDSPSVTVIVLNWNGRAFIEDCLKALLAQTYPHYSIIVVDNASSDDSVAFVGARFPQVEIIRSYRNLGFAAGNNIALKRVEDDLIALVNPDVILSASWLEMMVNQMLLNEQFAIAGCKLLYPESNLIQHAGGFVTHPQGLPGHHGFSEKDQGQYNTQRDVEYVIGAGMCIKRRVLDEIGLFDEGFFLFFEDADLCYRARNAGYRIVYIPEAVAYHSESVTTNKGSPSYFRRFHTSRWRWLMKHIDPMEIIDQTVEAEGNWLSNRDLQERVAAGHGYALTLAHFDEIIQARISDRYLNQEPLIETFQKQILQSLKTLHKQATGEQSLDDLRVGWRVQEGIFESQTPVIGPLLAKIRRMWNGVESAPYIGQILNQQNAFNRSIVDRLSDTHQGTQRQALDLKARSKELREIAAKLEKTNRRLSKLKERFEALAQDQGKQQQ